MTQTPTDDSHAADNLRWGIERLVLDYLRAKSGPDAVARRPLRGSDILTTNEPADFVEAISAAKYAAHVANGMATNWTRKARGAGRTWAELADALEVKVDPDSYEDPAAAAYMLAAGPRTSPFDRPHVGWDCLSCGKWVTDNGPYNGHPDDDESGHADNCQRHLAEIAAWRKRNDEEDFDA